jgi:Fe-S-cluster containining protein
LAELHLPDLRYECIHCGYSCGALHVELSEQEARGLTEIEPASVVERDERSWLRKEGCGSCHFLVEGEEGRCRLHSDRGAAAKPRACREFPFRAVSTPGGLFVGASFACQAIVAGIGPQVSAEMAPPTVMRLPEFPLAPGVELDWERYTRWEARVLGLLRAAGQSGLWRAALETTAELVGRPVQPTPRMEERLQALFRGLLALAEGFSDPALISGLLEAHIAGSSYDSAWLGGPVEVGAILDRWREPWPLWPALQPFFEHLLFRKFLLEGPDVHSRICSLPLLAQILQFLVLARGDEGPAGILWALRGVEERLTFHSRGLAGYLGRCGQAFLEG